MSTFVLNTIPTNSLVSSRYFPIQTGSIITCSRCRSKVHKSAFSLVSSDFICPTCRRHRDELDSEVKLCKLCCRYCPLTKFLSLGEVGNIVVEDICNACKTQIVNGFVSQNIFIDNRNTDVRRFKCNTEKMNKRDEIPSKILKNDIYHSPISVTNPEILPKMTTANNNVNTTTVIKKYPSTPSLKSSSSTTTTTRTTPYKQSNAQKNCMDLKISYNELQLIVTEEIFTCLFDEKSSDLIIYSSSTADIEELYNDPNERREKIIDELVAFIKSTIEKVHCKTCKKAVPKADCFLHHGSFLCKDCSMRVAANHLMDWTNYSTVLIKCGRCKHFAPYSKFLKMNGIGDIKRQNTCSFCCLKKWREYYLGSKVW